MRLLLSDCEEIACVSIPCYPPFEQARSRLLSSLKQFSLWYQSSFVAGLEVVILEEEEPATDSLSQSGS